MIKYKKALLLKRKRILEKERGSPIMENTTAWFGLSRPEEKEDVLDFINMVFSCAHCPHDFAALLPKCYRLDLLDPDCHYIAKEGSRIKALVGSYPVTQKVLDETLSFLSAPVSALILLTVGYGLDFSRVKWGETFKTIGARVVIFAVFGAVLYRVFTAAFPAQPIVAYATIMAFILPPTFMYAVPIKDAEESAYVGSVLAIYTLITLIGFVGLTWMAA